MGTWGHGTFADDTALDWAGDFGERPRLAKIERALQRAAGTKRSLSDVSAAGALVAAELVAALRGHASRGLPEELRDWVATQPVPPAVLAQSARRAVSRVATSSELREEWEDAGSLGRWRRELETLTDRLTRPAKKRKPIAPKSKNELPAPIPDADDDPMRPVGPGATYALPMRGGHFGVCRVLRIATPADLAGVHPAKQRLAAAPRYRVIAVSPWVGKRVPRRPSSPEMRRILTLTHHGFDGQPDVRLVRLPFPRRAVLVGHLQPSPAEARLRPPGPHFRAFDCDLDLFDQPLMQLEWDRMARKRR